MPDLEFYHCMDTAPITGTLIDPAGMARKAMARAALQWGFTHGRITLWLWEARGKKLAYSMARRGGEGGDKPVRTILGAPPENDADKTDFVYLGERE